MIGQNRLKETLDNLINDNNFPRFSILVGMQGSGKRTIAKYIGKSIGAEVVEVSTKVDDVRNIIEQAYKVTSKVVYIISDCDAMSGASSNALLKVTEEPPNNAYFIVTVQDINKLLGTIKSRASVFNMDAYTPYELREYTESKYQVDAEEMNIIRHICETPYEVDMILKSNAKEFYGYVEKVVDNIAVVSGSNAFKLTEKLALKDEEDKYDIRLFWKIFMKICLDSFPEDPFKYKDGIHITSKYLQQLGITGVNKVMLTDNWILDIRGAWL